jgi:hypothetical protein
MVNALRGAVRFWCGGRVFKVGYGLILLTVLGN